MWSLRATSCAGKLALSAWFVGGLCLSLFAIFDPNPARAYSEEQQAALKASHGRAALIRGQYRDADRLFTGALQSAALPFATRISTLSNRGIARWRLHHLRAALDDFNAALKFAPEEATLYNNRGNVLMALNLHEEAAKDFGQAIALAPSYGAAYHNRGNARFLLGKYAAAVADFTKAVTLLPRNPAPFNGRGKAQFALKRPAGAMRDFSRAIALNARYGQAYANRAEALAALRRYRDAIDDYTSAIQFGTDTPEVYRGRASVYTRLNKPNLALKDIQEAKERAPGPSNNPDAEPAQTAAARRAGTPASAGPPLATLVCEDKKSLTQTERRTGLAKVADASDGSVPDSLLVRTKSGLEDLAGQAEIVEAKERAALPCDPKGKPDPESPAEAATGEDGGEQFIGPEVEDWTVELTAKGAYVARHQHVTAIRLTLEMYGSGEPELLHWLRLKGSLRRIGLLHYYAGASPRGERLEYIALIDMYSGRLIAIEPCRWGEQQAKWNWTELAVVVVDPQGVPSRVQVRERATSKRMVKVKRAKAKRAKPSFQRRDWRARQNWVSRRGRPRFNPYALGYPYPRASRPWRYP